MCSLPSGIIISRVRSTIVSIVDICNFPFDILIKKCNFSLPFSGEYNVVLLLFIVNKIKIKRSKRSGV